MDLNSKTRYFIVLYILSLLGCLPEPLPVENIPILSEQIVVSTQVLTNNSVSLSLTKSFGALDANGGSDPQELLNLIAINDATVVISGFDNQDTLTFLDNGTYVSGDIPLVEGEWYTLYIESTSMGIASASTKVQELASFDEVSANIIDGGFDSLAQVNYSFEDLPGQNYYMINTIPIALDRLQEPDEILNPNIFTKLLTDEATNNGLLAGTFSALLRGDKLFTGDTLMLQLSHISEEYYEYLTLRNDGEFSLSTFIGEPINYPTNVENGLGWFNLHIPDVRIVILRK